MFTKSRKMVIFICSFVLLTGLACSLPFSNIDLPDLNLFKKDQPEEVVPPVELPVEQPQEMPVPPSEPSAPVQQAPAAQPEDVDLQISNSLFVQDETELTTAFVLSNIASQTSFTNIEYTVLAFDASGATLQTDTGVIDFILPGENYGTVSTIYLEEGEVVNSVDVEWTATKDTSTDFKSPIVISNPRFFEDGDYDTCTAVVKNLDQKYYTNVRVNAIGFDSAGAVVGGGYAYINFIPAEDQVGITAYVTMTQEPASVVFYPSISSWSASFEAGDWENNLQLVDFGFVQDGDEVGGGFLVKNITDQLLIDSEYYVTVYEADGSVSDYRSGYIDLLWPGETIGVTPGSFYLPEGSTPKEVDVVLMPGEFGTHELTANPLSTTDVTYKADAYWPVVNLAVVNNLASSVSWPVVHVLVFDANGKIVGGGLAYPDDLAANGTTNLDVYLTYVGDGAPTRIEAYARMTGWSELGD